LHHRKTKGLFLKGSSGCKNSMKSSAKQFLGQTPIGFDPKNKTTNTGKIPKYSSPPKIL
jgi:hypothetical protein